MIIDYVDNLEIPDEAAEQQFNELRSLEYLSKGLNFLNAQVQRLESEIRDRLGNDRIVRMYGSAPELEGIPQDFVACAFHWYSVTACNYVKLAGWLINGGDTSKATKYLQHVLPQLHIWRNKVGAHFARIDPRPEDTPADLAKSVIFPISFDDDAFFEASLVLTIGGSSSGLDLRWSLTHTDDRLSARYWPSSG